MKERFLKIFTILLLLSFVASPAVAVPPDGYLKVVHLAPFAEDASVTISVDGEDVLTEFDYGDSTDYIPLRVGDHNIAITPTGATEPVLEVTVNLGANNYFTAIAVGDIVNQPLALLQLEDDNTAPAAGNFKLRLGHLAPFADTIAGTTADVRLDDGTLLLDDVQFGAVAPYVELPAGEYDLKITTPDGETTLINLAPVTLMEGQIVSAFAVGNGTFKRLEGYALPYDAPGFFLPLEARLQVAHLAPFADPGTVDIELNGVPALQNVDYGGSTGYIELVEGNYDVEIFPDGSDTAAISALGVELTGMVDYTAIAIGDGVNQDLSLKLLVDDNSAPAAGNFKLRLGHLAPFAPDPDTTADVRLDDGTVILDDVDFGDVEVYIEFPAGEYDLKVTTPDGAITLIDLAPVTFTEGQILSAFAVGNGTIQPLGGFGLPAGEPGFFLPLEPIETARLQVAHLAPFADPATVDISINGEPVPALQDFNYGDSTAYIELPEGSYLVEIFPDGSTTAAISETVNLLAGNDYTAVAVGDIVNQPLGLLALMDDNTAPGAGNFKLRLGHLAPFADTLAGTLADIRQDDGTPVLENVDFGDVAPYLELPAGEYDLKVTTSGGGTTLINLAPVTFSEGQILSAFAIGDGNNQDLGGFALPADAEGFFLPLDMARLQVAHLAPFADPGTVDIELNGELALENVDYGDSTGYLDLMEGSYLVEIIPDGATDPAISETVDLVGGNDYTAIAVGDIANQPLDLLAMMDDNTAPAAGNFKLRLGHLAPFADTLAGTLADIRQDDGTPVLLNVEFGDVAPYVELPAGEYDLKITTPGGATTLINLAPITFIDGQILSAFAVGNGTVQPLGGFALPSGEPGFFLPLDIARLQVAHLAPFADPGTVDIELNGELALENIDYGDSTGYIELMEGSYLVEITPDGAMAPAISETVDLVGDNDYTAIAVGDGVNQPLDLLALMDDNTAPAAGTFKLRLGHLAPFADTLPGTLADVRLDDGTVILDDVEFGDVDAYAELPAGVYDLKVTTPDGATTLIDLAPVSFMEGQILSAFAVGNGSVQPLGGFALPSGEPGFFLPLERFILYLPLIVNSFTP